jgi:hypothetical protein
VGILGTVFLPAGFRCCADEVVTTRSDGTGPIFSAAIIAFYFIPLSLFVLRDSPQDANTFTDGVAPLPVRQKARREEASGSLSLRPSRPLTSG